MAKKKKKRKITYPNGTAIEFGGVPLHDTAFKGHDPEPERTVRLTPDKPVQ